MSWFLLLDSCGGNNCTKPPEALSQVCFALLMCVLKQCASQGSGAQRVEQRTTSRPELGCRGGFGGRNRARAGKGANARSCSSVDKSEQLPRRRAGRVQFGTVLSVSSGPDAGRRRLERRSSARSLREAQPERKERSERIRSTAFR